MSTYRTLAGGLAFALPVIIATEVEMSFWAGALLGILGGLAAAYIWVGSIKGNGDNE